MKKALVLFALLLSSCNNAEPPKPQTEPKVNEASEASLRDPQEKHLANIRQLTFEGENAEAYWSPDGSRLIFQRTAGEVKCDQIFTMRADGSDLKMVSNGKGRTTCAYFFDGGNRILFSSTHEANPECPPPPDYSKGYVWPIHKDYDIYVANADGSDLKKLTDSPGYDAEATVSPDGKRIVFTSMRDGDLDIYTMDIDGKNVKRLTSTPGYDGGAFFSPDGQKIVYRASRPSTDEELREYKALLKEGMIRPSKLEIFVMNADGSEQQQITNTGKANFCPFFHPNGRKIIFSSNFEDPKGREFDLYMIDIEGHGLERITYTAKFDGFPMFSPDGKRLVWASNRNGKAPTETNIFVADWVE